MAKEIKKIEELPVIVNGKEEMVPKGKYAGFIANELTMALKVDIKKANIVDLLEQVAKGQELDPSNPPEWQKVYDRLVKDVDRAAELLQERADALLAQQEQEKQDKIEKEKAEDKLVEVAQNTDVTATFSNMSKLFDLGNMDRIVPKGKVTDEQLVGALATSLAMDNFTNWAKGDLVNLLMERGHEGAMVKMSESAGIPYKSLYRMAATAKVVTADERREGVSFTTYAEIANARIDKDEAKQTEAIAGLIARVGAEGEGAIKTAQDARGAVEAAQGKTGPASNTSTAPNTEKDDFIVFGVDSDPDRVVRSKGLPDALKEGALCVIHKKTGKRMVGKKWVDLDEYKAPEATPAAADKKKGAKKK